MTLRPSKVRVTREHKQSSSSLEQLERARHAHRSQRTTAWPLASFLLRLALGAFRSSALHSSWKPSRMQRGHGRASTQQALACRQRGHARDIWCRLNAGISHQSLPLLRTSPRYPSFGLRSVDFSEGSVHGQRDKDTPFGWKKQERKCPPSPFLLSTSAQAE